MNNASSAEVKRTEPDLLVELSRKLVRWGIRRPSSSSPVEERRAEEQSTDLASLTTSLTKHLDAIHQHLRENKRSVASAAKELKGLPSLLTSLRQSRALCSSHSFVSAYVRILLWFVSTARKEETAEDEAAGDLAAKERDSKIRVKGRDWALAELAILLGRNRVDEFIPHAKHLGFQVDDPNKFISSTSSSRSSDLRQQQQQQQQPEQDDNDDEFFPAFDDAFIDLIEDFLLKALRVFADAQEASNVDQSSALTQYLNRVGGSAARGEERQIDDDNNDDDDHRRRQRRYFLRHLYLPHVTFAVVTLVDDLKARFRCSRLDVDCFAKVVFRFIGRRIVEIPPEERLSLSTCYPPEIIEVERTVK